MALEATAPPSTDSIERSLNDLLGHEGRQLFHLVAELENVVGQRDAAVVVDRALVDLARWRLDRVAARLQAPFGPTEALHAWIGGEIYGFVNLGWGHVDVTENKLVLSVTEAPDLRLLASRGREDLYLRTWSALFDELATRADAENALIETRWLADERVARIALKWPTAQLSRFDPARVRFHAVPGLEETVETRAAQFHFFAKNAIATYDATGEHALRRGVQEFARERGRALRERHQSQGLPLDLASMMSDFDYGGEGVWQFNPGTLTPTEWSQDCTHCPFARVWRDLDGLETGYIYDMEFHVAEFMEYNPGMRVTWEKLQTRGDAICAFRFSLPQG